MTTNIFSFIIVLSVLILVHELGHFLVARLFGVGVLKFSLGFGPRIAGRTVGITDYRLSAIPLGGYVKMVGDEPDALLHFFGLLGEVHSVDDNPPGSGFQNARHHLDGRGFSGTVRSKKTEETPFLHLQIEVVHGAELFVGLRQMNELNHIAGPKSAP